MQLAGAVQQFLFIESVSPKPSIWRSERNSSRETVELEKRAADAADLTFLTCSWSDFWHVLEEMHRLQGSRNSLMLPSALEKSM